MGATTRIQLPGLEGRGLTGFQIAQLIREKVTAQKPTAAAIHRFDSVATVNPWQQEQNEARARAIPFLSEDQRNKLTAAAAVLQRSDAGTELVGVGAITCAQWLQLAELEALRVAQGMTSEERKRAVLDILDSAQRAKLASFETDLRIVDQAIELRLLPRRPTGAYPCHN